MPKSKPLERNLQATVFRKLKALRAEDDRLAYRKRHGSIMGLTGDPDVYGLWAGIAWELELKAPGEIPTALQRERLDEWHKAGAVTAVIDHAKAFDGFIALLQDFVWRARGKPGAPAMPVGER
jgi:hypothetical protein